MDTKLRTLEQRWIKQGKSKEQIRKLRWWYKNKDRIQGERKSLNVPRSLFR